MASLASSSFILAPTTDRYLELDNAEWVRELTIGNSWTKIRLAILASIVPSGTGDIVPKFVLGMCSGSSNPFGAATTTNFVGAGFVHNLTLTYGAGSGNPSFVSANSTGFISRVNTTVNYGGGLSGNFFTTTGTLARRTPLIVDITKGSPNYTIKTYTPATVDTDVSYAEFVSAVEAASDPTAVGSLGMQSVSNPMAASESPGNLDHVDLFWSLAATPLRVYAILAKKLS